MMIPRRTLPSLLLLLSPGASTAAPRAVNALIVSERKCGPADPSSCDSKACSPSTSSAFYRPIRPSTPSVLVHRRTVHAREEGLPLSCLPAGASGSSLASPPPRIGCRRTAELLDSLRGGATDRGYYRDDYGEEDRSRGSSRRGGGRRGYDYDYGEDAAGRQDGQQGGEYEDEYYGDAGGLGLRDGGGYYDDRSYYPEEGESVRSRGGRSSSASSPLSNINMPDMIRTGNKKVGLALLSAGAVLTFLGITLFFNKSLMRMGNLLFVAGVPMTLGPGRTAGYFLQPSKARATGCLAVGMFLVFVGWPVVGIALEVFGLLNLFGNMFPVAMALLRNMPVVGSLLGNGNGGGSSAARRKNQRSVDDDDDGYGYRDDRYYYGDEGNYGGAEGSRDNDSSGYY